MSAAASLRLVLACATWERSPARTGAVAAAGAARDLDWTHWMSLIRYHRLVPHAHRQLDGLGAAPAATRDALVAGARETAERSLALTRQLAELMRALERMGVAALPYKGPALSFAAYGELGARRSTDLDVVVAERDVDRARHVLAGEGYRSRYDSTPAQERAVQRSFGHFEYERAGAASRVELHWRFAPPGYPWTLPFDEVRSRAERWLAGGVALDIPEPNDHVLLQCMHGARHQWQQLEWLVALREQLRRDDVDAALLIDRATRNGSRRALLLGLTLARDMLGAGLPEPLGAAIAADAGLATLVARVRAYVERAEPQDALADPHELNAGLMENTRDRVRYLVHRTFTPTLREWQLVRLPDALLPLYYPIRLGRLLLGRGQAVRRFTR